MKALLDTSVLVAAMIDAGPAHERAQLYKPPRSRGQN